MKSIRFVPTAVYGILDYVGPVGLIATPVIFGFVSIGGVAVILPIVFGLSLIIYSLMTDLVVMLFVLVTQTDAKSLRRLPAARLRTRRPALRVIPMRVHLILWRPHSSPRRPFSPVTRGSQ